MNQKTAHQEEELAAMQAEALYSLSINAFMSVAAATIVTAVYWSEANMPVLLSWLALDYGHALVWMVLAVIRKRPGSGGLSPTTWRSVYVLLMAMGGMIWGLSGFLLLPLGSTEQALLTGLVAMGAVLATYPTVIYPQALIAFQMPVFTLCAVGYISSGISYGTVIATLAVLFSVALVQIGKQMGDKLISAMRMAIENAEMVRLQEEQSVALAKANEELERLSYVDPLTGLFNRRRLMQELRSNARDAGSSMLVIDVDHFKQYNDTYGHGAGDVCLIEIARVLARHSNRNQGFAARQGGEEFCLLFGPNTARPAEDIAEDIRADIENLINVATDLEKTVTASIGLAFRAADMHDDQFMFAADQAVYRAKRTGRNRVCRADQMDIRGGGATVLYAG